MKTDLTISDNLKNETTDAVEQAQTINVVDNESNVKATNHVRVVKMLQKEIEKELNPAIEDANKLHKKLVAQKKKFLEALQKAEQLFKFKISSFLKKQEEARREEQRKAAEKARREEEARKKKFEEQAKNHEENGRHDKAAERREMAEEVHVPTPIVPNEVPMQKGIKKTVNWKFRITDESLIPREYLIIDEKTIRGVVKSLKDKTRIPGVEVYADESIAVAT